METIAVKPSSGFEKLRNLIYGECDLGYLKMQNVLLSCDRDGCTRINHCTCDCNDSTC